MLTAKAICFFLLLCRFVNDGLSNNSEISELIENIHEQSNSGTLHFVGIEEDFLSEFLKSHFLMPVLILTEGTADEYVRFGNVILIVNVVRNETQLSVILDKLITSLDVRKFVIVSAYGIDSMKQWFRYFAEKKFTRIFGNVGGDNFAYLPYAAIQVHHLIKEEPLPDAQKDFNGFALRTTVQKDIPRTFWYPDGHGKNQVGGTYGQIYVNFLRRHNATFKEIIINNSTKLDITKVINATINNDVDISMNVFCAIKTLDLSYPVRIEKYIIMVGLNGYVDPKEYFQRPFSFVVWIYIGLIVTYVTIMDVILKYFTNLAVDIWESFSQVYLTLLRMPTERPIHSAYSMHFQVTVLSFIIGNMYVIYFTSYLTVHIKVKQYESVKDLVENNIRILIPYFEWVLIERNGLFPKGFEKMVEPTDYDSYFVQLYSMRNTSVAFTLGSEKCEFLIRMQSLYEKPLFRKTSDVVKPYYLGFLLPFNSPFKEIFSNFIIEIKQTGLIEKWETDIFAQATRAGFKIGAGVDREVGIESLYNPLTCEHLSFAWNCLTIGLTMAAIIFLAESLAGGFSKVCKRL